jgi:hypothetical protein
MENCPFTLIPYIKLNPSYFVLYNQVQWHNVSKKPVRKKPDMPVVKSPQGLVSKRAAAKIKHAIDWLLYIANDKSVISNYSGRRFKFKLSFITLTLSSKQVHSDAEIKSQLLNQFLIEARKKWNVKHYLWRAEAQINGNIHFHILCDKFIPWSELRDTWNRIQNKLGYVDNYREEMRAFHKGGFKVRQELLSKWSYKNQVRAYRTGCQRDWSSPNSTDIHSVANIKNLPSYLSKYCTKQTETRLIEGNVWNLSESLSKINGATDVIYSEMMEEISTIFKKFPAKVHHEKYYTIAYIPVHLWRSVVSDKLISLFNEYLEYYKNFYT